MKGMKTNVIIVVYIKLRNNIHNVLHIIDSLLNNVLSGHINNCCCSTLHSFSQNLIFLQVRDNADDSKKIFSEFRLLTELLFWSV